MQNRRTAVEGRQLTIGECAAVARYADAFRNPDTGRVDLAELLDFMDRAEVCTTCGWSRAIHEAGSGQHRLSTVCPQHSREL